MIGDDDDDDDDDDDGYPANSHQSNSQMGICHIGKILIILTQNELKIFIKLTGVPVFFELYNIERVLIAN